MGLSQSDQGIGNFSNFSNPRAGIGAFQAAVSRLVLHTVAVGAVMAAALVGIVHVYHSTGSFTDWLYLLAALGLGAMSWWESRRSRPRTLVPLIAMLLVIVSRLATADLFVAAALLVPMLTVGMMGTFSLPDRELRVFTWVFFVLSGVAAVSYVVRFETGSEVWRGIIAATVGAGLGIILVVLLRRENERFVARYESLYDGVSIGLVRLSVDGRLIAGNRQLATMLGLESADELEGSEVRSIVFDDHDFESAMKLVRDGTPGEIRLRRSDGNPLWARVTFSSVTLEGGELLGYEGLVEDLTESRKVEAVANRAEARFATVFDSAPIGMALVDDAGAVIRANRAFTSLAGLPPFEPPGVPWASVLDGQLGDPSRFTGPHSEDLEDEISVAGADGETRWIRFRVSRPPAQGGYGHFAIVQLLDVTSHVGLESVLREQVRAKNDFIATVSHELRTPLTAVVGFVDELRGALGNPSGEVLEMLDILAAESTSLSNIVEDLLVAARADIDQLSVAQETVDLSDVINRVIRASSRLALDHGASIHLKCSSAVATADSRRVEQILWNLITNAIRHGGSEITICGRREDARVLITVEDNGLGVPAKAIDEIFEPYRSFTLDQGVTTSMGLGLYVARKLAQLMGGDLSAGVDGVRTEFVLELPGPQPVATAQLSLAE